MGIMIDADHIVYDANIITMDNDRPIAEGIAIKDGKILWIGTNDEVKSSIGKNTLVTRLKGKTIIPGFIDAHHHTMQYGLNLLGIDLTKTSSIDEILKIVKEESEKKRIGTWIFGIGYNQNQLKEKRHPNRFDLDKIAPNNPVVLKHTSGHNYSVNSMALKLAGINSETPDPLNGKIDKDQKTNLPTGLLFSFSAMKLIGNLLPTPSYEDMLTGLKMANNIMISEGITSATDARVGMVDAPRQIAVYQDAFEKGFLKVRHTLGIWCNSVLDFSNLKEAMRDIEWKLLGMGIRTGFGNRNLKIGALKFVTDGALSTATAATFQPYGYDSSKQSCGVLMIEQKTLEELALKTHELGWQLSIHAIGDRAIDTVINAMEYVNNNSKIKLNRPRIEHLTLVTPEMLKKVKKLKATVVLQPTFLWQLGDNWISQLGYDRFKAAKPFKLINDLGIKMAFSSDRPSVLGAPLLGIHSAVNQRTKDGNDLSSKQKISVKDALKCYTENAAYADFDEKIKGTLKIGKLADFVVLEDNLFETPSSEIKNLKILHTCINGSFVYSNV